MNTIDSLSQSARQAFNQKNWAEVERHAKAIIALDKKEGEGYFLLGLMANAKRDRVSAMKVFEKCLSINPHRYDAAIELANIYSRQRRNGEAAELIKRVTPMMQNDPRYLDLAGTTYVQIGMPAEAWPLYLRVNELQPNIDIFQANLANCAVYLGELEKAQELYEKVIQKNPWHRQNHYHFARLVKAKDMRHIEAMLKLLEEPNIPENRNTPICFALGKEYEDIGDWENAYKYYAKGNDIISRIVKYNPQSDIKFTEEIARLCSKAWYEGDATDVQETSKTPIFIAGLPRTGTTLIERILTSHSRIGTVGETLFVQQTATSLAADHTNIFNAEAYKAFLPHHAKLPEAYLKSLSYRLGDDPYFIEKLPLNFLFLGPLAKAWPNAKFVVVNRNPLDTSLSLFKQVFTWAYKFSYDLSHIGQYYMAYLKLMRHWKDLLGDRLIEVDYETLVGSPEAEIRNLLGVIGVDYEEACVNFHLNNKPSTTASSVQVRSKISTSSIGKWRHFEDQLGDLKKYYEDHGVDV